MYLINVMGKKPHKQMRVDITHKQNDRMNVITNYICTLYYR